MRFRGWLYSLGMASCGKNFQVTHSAILNGLDNMFVGKDVYIANFGNFICNDPIYIGDGVLFGPSVVMSSGNHVLMVLTLGQRCIGKNQYRRWMLDCCTCDNNFRKCNPFKIINCSGCLSY